MKVPTPKAINKSEFGLGKQCTTVKGPYGGGTKYNQMKNEKAFELNQVKGHKQNKPNMTPVYDNKQK